jgi:hypothetical protein
MWGQIYSSCAQIERRVCFLSFDRHVFVMPVVLAKARSPVRQENTHQPVLHANSRRGMTIQFNAQFATEPIDEVMKRPFDCRRHGKDQRVITRVNIDRFSGQWRD